MAADSMVMRANVMQAVHDDAEGLRAWLCDPGIEDLWKAAFLARLRHAERDAVRLYAEARKLVNSQVDMAVFVLQTVGAPASEARAAVDSQRNVAALAQDRPAMAAKLARWLDEYRTENGMTWEQIAALASGAEVIESMARLRFGG